MTDVALQPEFVPELEVTELDVVDGGGGAAVVEAALEVAVVDPDVVR